MKRKFKFHTFGYYSQKGAIPEVTVWPTDCLRDTPYCFSLDK